MTAQTAKKKTSGMASLLTRFGSRELLLVVGGLFVLDLFTPDPLPFIDEAVLGILTLLIARWQSRNTASGATPESATESAPKPPPKNVTPS